MTLKKSGYLYIWVSTITFYTMMLKNLILLLLLFSCFSSIAQTAGKGKKNNRAKHAAAYVLDSSFAAQLGKSPVELLVDKFADSLNNLRRTGIYPAFLLDPQFDYKYSTGSPSHHPLPLRQMIISKVHECISLKMILDRKEDRYKLKPARAGDIDVLYQDLSFFDLVDKRYQEMSCLSMY